MLKERDRQSIKGHDLKQITDYNSKNVTEDFSHSRLCSGLLCLVTVTVEVAVVEVKSPVVGVKSALVGVKSALVGVTEWRVEAGVEVVIFIYIEIVYQQLKSIKYNFFQLCMLK